MVPLDAALAEWRLQNAAMHKRVTVELLSHVRRYWYPHACTLHEIIFEKRCLSRYSKEKRTTVLELLFSACELCAWACASFPHRTIRKLPRHLRLGSSGG